MIKLRPYQQDAVNQIRQNFAKGNNRLVVCAPTGAGKTIIFCAISKMAQDRNSKILIITNRKELLMQTDGSLSKFDISADLLNPSKKHTPTKRIVVSMVETLKRRLKNKNYGAFLRSFDVIIIDECHINSFNKIFDYVGENQRILGFSATPYREKKKDELAKYYDSLIDVVGIDDLVGDGYLSKPLSYGVPIDLKGVKTKMGDYDVNDLEAKYDDNIIYTGAIDNYKRLALGLKTIVFCASIKNSKKLRDLFISNGYNAKHFDCYMSDFERRDILTWFYNTKDAILCNVGILTTGFDCPDIKCVILYRATKSLPLFLQMVGRGSRVTENKQDFLILDFGNNIKTHGFWEQARTWSLEVQEKKKKKKTDVPTITECKNCGALIEANLGACPFCGYQKPKPEKTAIEVTLEKLTPSEVQRFANNCSIEELEEIRMLKNYKIGWVLHKLTTLEEYEYYGKIKNYKSGWAKYQWNKFRG